jgi:predicted ATPase/DNA-binding SARP family transcriptional activator
MSIVSHSQRCPGRSRILINTRDIAPTAETVGATLRIALLGPPTLTWGDQPLAITRRQARALLYRIAATSHPVPREQLAYLLWPDSSEATARRNLTVLLTQIRQALPQLDLLLTLDDTISLNRTAVVTDTAILAKLIHEAAGAGRLDRLAEALRQYRGPFLDGFSLPGSAEFDAWASQERQVWERRYLDALAVLVEGYAAARQYHAAIDAAQRFLAIDELAEDMHRRLIALYAAAGDRTTAVRQFERCVVALERELGVEPLPETRAAYEAARDGQNSATETRTYGDAGASRQAHQQIRNEQVSMSPSLPVSMPGQFPAPSGSLFGRSAELAEACAMLQDGDARLLTLCGPGGSGKTRLALQVAWELRDRFADGVLFVPLAPLHDPELVIDAIAQACGLYTTGVVALGDEVRGYLREKQLLLILDNFEHLLPAALIVADFVAAAPGLRILATSRSVLNLSAEQVFPVLPLPLPDLAQLPPPAELAAQPTVALLLARTRAQSPSFQLDAGNAADIAAICVRLDGLPLAIELAAARLKTLSPRALLKRLDQRLSALDRGPRDLPDRQRTLRAAIEWSYRLLDMQVQRLFERLAVFAGGWTLEAADAVLRTEGRGLSEESSVSVFSPHSSVLDGLASLVDKSLIQAHVAEDGETRFGMLETIREYALERLRARGDEWAVRHRHADYYCQFAELCAPGYYSAEIAAIERDYHNVRGALYWALEAGQHELMARIVAAAFWYWDTRGLLEEAQTWIAQALQQGLALPNPWRARVRVYANYLAYRRGHQVETRELAALVGDEQVIAEDRALAQRVMGLSALQSDDIAGARRHFEQALEFAQDHGSWVAVAAAQYNLGLLYLFQDDLEQAEALLWASYEPWEQRRHPRYIGVALVTLGYIAALRGDAQQAGMLLRDGLQQLIMAQEKIYLLYGLLACAGFATVQQQPLYAAVLFGAGTRHAENMRLAIIRGVLTRMHQHIEQARGQCIAEEFDQALQQGYSLALEEAVALAQLMIEEAHGHQERVLGNRWALAR